MLENLTKFIIIRVLITNVKKIFIGVIMENRNKFSSKWGFIMACVGSAVGLANVWAFPYQLGANGGLAFLLPYLIFAFIFGRVGLAAENAIGRKYKSGPMVVYREAYKERNMEKFGRVIRWLPMIGVGLLAIGYAVVITYVLKALIDTVSGHIFEIESATWFESISSSDFKVIIPHLILMILVYFALAYETKGIEKTNKLIMPLFFILFLILAIRVFFLEGAIEGYKFIFNLDVAKLKDIKTWVAAMGQAFFSLSLVGTVMVVYGSYLPDDEDVIESSTITMSLDTLSAMISSFVMLPACFAYGFSPESGPKLLFVVLPQALKEMPLGRLYGIILFLAVVFAGISSIQSMLETITEAIVYSFPKLKRKIVLIALITTIYLVGIFIEPISKWGPWMDIVTIYILPISGIIGAITWFWVIKKEELLAEVNKNVGNKYGNLWYYTGKFIFVPLAIVLCFIAMKYHISF